MELLSLSLLTLSGVELALPKQPLEGEGPSRLTQRQLLPPSDEDEEENWFDAPTSWSEGEEHAGESARACC